MSDLKSVVTELLGKIEASYNAQDYEGLVKLFTDDCKTVTPGKEPVCGKEELLKLCKEPKGDISLSIKCGIKEICASDDSSMVYVLARVDMTKADGSSGGTSNEMFVLKKVGDCYQVKVDMWNI
ncbi:orange carotenoid-binding protein-like [Glandiceps talaboti]